MRNRLHVLAAVLALALLAACVDPSASADDISATTVTVRPATTRPSTTRQARVDTTILAAVAPIPVPEPAVGPIDPATYLRCTSGSGAAAVGTPVVPVGDYSNRPTLLQSAAAPTAPLLVMFHGQHGCIENMQSRSQLDELATVGKVNVLWLSGAPLPKRSWNVNGRCCDPASENRLDDLAYVDAAIAAAVATGVEPSAVIAVGVSNGAAMAIAAACARPGLFAGAVSVGGWMPGPCAATALSLLAVGGSADDVVGRETPAVISEYWRTSVVACPNEPALVAANDVVTATWQGCTGGTVVRHVRLAGVGHVWPKFVSYDVDLDILSFAAGHFSG